MHPILNFNGNTGGALRTCSVIHRYLNLGWSALATSNEPLQTKQVQTNACLLHQRSQNLNSGCKGNGSCFH